MKTLAIIVGGVITIGTLAFGAMALNASAVQKQFFARVQAVQVDLLMQDMHPALRDQIDEPMLTAFVAAIHANMGDLVGVTQTAFRSNMTDKGTRVETEATVEFQHGTLISSLVTLDGLLLSFDVQSDNLVNWFSGPATTQLYEQESQAFLQEMLSGDTVIAHEMCHSSLQKMITVEQLGQMSASIHQQIGTIESISLLSTDTKQKTQEPELVITFEVITDRLTTSADITIQFEGLQGHLVGFDVTLPQN